MALYERLRINKSRIGTQYGKWTQVGPSFRLRTGSKQRKTFAVFQCACGSVHVIHFNNITRGLSSKCDQCNRNEFVDSRRKHGLYQSPEYSIWVAIIQRCENKNCSAYKDYGGRGIAICQRWRESFSNFLKDMGTKPGSGYDVDRKDNNGNYEPKNCWWVTHKKNMQNRRGVIRVNYHGVVMSLKEVSETIGMPYARLRQRLAAGWSLENAIKAPRHARRRRETQGLRGDDI